MSKPSIDPAYSRTRNSVLWPFTSWGKNCW